MASDKDYYAVLGVTPEDDVTLIKRRYRQLVRENHPDIAADRISAHETMLDINAAWTILSDPAERARYDRSRGFSLTPKPRSPADEYIAGKNRATTSSPRSAPQSAPQQAPARGTARGSGQTRTRLLTMVFEAAELYFFQGRAEDAIAICQTVMKADPSNAEAPALLGDIYADQGRRDVAQQMYEIAMRNQPDNPLYAQKLSALGGAPPKSSSRNSAPRSTSARSSTPARSSASSSRTTPANSNAMRGGNVRTTIAQKNAIRSRAGFALLAIAVAFVVSGCVVASAGEDALPLSWLPGTDVVPGILVWTTALAALLGGMALPLLDLLPRCCALRPDEPRWLGVPLLILMLVASAIFFPLAALLWLVASLARGGAIKSWLVILFASLVLASTVSLGLRDDRLIPSVLVNACLWWSGRTILPMLVMGWALGSQAARK